MNVTKILAEQMVSLGRLGPPFANALEAARCTDVSVEFLRDGFSLLQQITGRPGEGAPDCLRDAPKDLASTRAFLGKWAHYRASPGYEDVLREAERTAKALMEFNETIRGLDKSEQREVEGAAKMGHDISTILRGKVPPSAWIGAILVAVDILLIVLIVITMLRSGSGP
jgi:hypothetical protein